MLAYVICADFTRIVLELPMTALTAVWVMTGEASEARPVT